MTSVTQAGPRVEYVLRDSFLFHPRCLMLKANLEMFDTDLTEPLRWEHQSAYYCLSQQNRVLHLRRTCRSLCVTPSVANGTT